MVAQRCRAWSHFKLVKIVTFIWCVSVVRLKALLGSWEDGLVGKNACHTRTMTWETLEPRTLEKHNIAIPEFLWGDRREMETPWNPQISKPGVGSKNSQVTLSQTRWKARTNAQVVLWPSHVHHGIHRWTLIHTHEYTHTHAHACMHLA